MNRYIPLVIMSIIFGASTLLYIYGILYRGSRGEWLLVLAGLVMGTISTWACRQAWRDSDMMKS